jgi:acetylornithine deacetylase/succinyl-diaminopimelate desuccinylase-like protein
MPEHMFAMGATGVATVHLVSDRITGESTELLQTLIRSRCVNDGDADSGHESRNTDVLRAYLEGPGVELQEYESRPGRTSLVARLEGSDPAAPTICLMGHTDVVPVNPDGWTKDPFGGEVVDGEIWGRGALDMLYQTATQAVAFRHLVREGMRPRGTLIYFAVPDEEAGGTWGARWMIDHHWDAIACDYLLTELAGVVMPTPAGPRVTVTVAEKGIAWRRLRVRGTPGHGSMPYGADNAVVKAAEIVRRIEARRPRAGLGEVWRETVAAYGFDRSLEARLLEPTTVFDALADIPDRDTATVLHACSHTTISPNVVHGGVKSNVIPDTVEIDLDIRTLPGITGDEVDAELRDLIGDDLAPHVVISRLQDDESTASPISNEMWDALARRAAAAHPGSSLLPQLEIGATDARFFRAKGTVAYGTGLFSAGLTYEDMVSRFHGNDERIDVDSLRLTTDLWLGVAHDVLR